MIVPMKKITVLALADDLDAAVDALAGLGAVHVKHAVQPTGERVERITALRRKLRLVLAAMPDDAGGGPTGMEPARTVRRGFEVIRRKKLVGERLDELRGWERRLAPFGNFDPADLDRLEEAGVYVTLHNVGVKESLAIPDGAAAIELSRGKNSAALAVVALERPFDGPGRVFAGDRSLKDLRGEIEALEKELSELDERMRSLAGDRGRVEELLAGIEKRLEYAEVSAGMGSVDMQREPLVLLRGYVPAPAEEHLMASVAQNGWGLILEDPEEGDDPPTLLRNPSWVRPVKAVFDAVGVLPGYRESDVSAPMLLFLSLFFAMLVGDAGYGLLFMVLAAVGKAKFKRVPNEVFTLLFIMSGCTVVWGVLTGNWFGLSGPPGPLAGLKIKWLTGPNADENIMGLTFLIGAVHLTLAHAWTVVRLAPDTRALAQFGWLGVTWVMYFAAMSLVLMRPFPQYAFWVLGAGIALIVIFTVPPSRIKSDWTEFVMVPLSLISNFVDVVSYVRLFAVGAATFAVANAFNQMAADLAGGVISGLGAALVLFFGHALNILLASMGVLVHGVRLNTLEFAGHMGLRWSGYRYAPFVSKGK